MIILHGEVSEFGAEAEGDQALMLDDFLNVKRKKRKKWLSDIVHKFKKMDYTLTRS